MPGMRDTNGGAVISGVWCPGVKGQAAGEGRRAKKMLAQCWRPPIQRPWCKRSDGVQAGGSWGRAGESWASVGGGVDRDLGQTRRNKQAAQAHPAMSCSPFSAGTAHSLNLNTHHQLGAAPRVFIGLQSPTHTLQVQLQLAI